MKKHPATANALIGGMLCIALLTSCQSKHDSRDIDYLSNPQFDTEEALPQYDHDKSWTHRLGGGSSCVTEDTFYFIGAIGNYNYIFYCDLSTGINGPLCGKPECPHNSDQCNAYTRGQAFGLSFYDGKLYWLDSDENWDPAIYYMNLDGTNRGKVRTLDRSQYQRVSANRILAFHRGYAIYGGQISIVSQGSVRYGVLVYAISLSTGDETVILNQMFGEGFAPSLELVPYRNRLYLITSYGVVGGLGETLSISEWSLKTHETLSLYSQSADSPFREAWPTEDGLLLSSALNGDIYKLQFATHKLSFLFDFNHGHTQDGGMEFSNDYIINWTLSEERVPHIRVTDLEGTIVYSEDLNLPDWPTQGYGYGLMGADHNNLYVQLQSIVERADLGMTWNKTIIAQIPLDGGGSVRELWSLERELG